MIACKTEIETPLTYTDLNGNWTTTSHIVQTGTCTFTNPTSTLVQAWSVDTNGNLTVTESANGGASKTWTGTVDSKFNFTMTSEQNVTCNGTATNRTFTMSGQITKAKAVITFAGTANYDLCPPNCLFNLEYSGTK